VKRLLVILLLACSASAGEVRVSAAASLSDVLTEIARLYRGDAIVLNFGASSLLARQIVAGAPVDLFVSADEAQMDRVPALVRVPLLTNQLMVVGKPLAQAQRIAIANPDAGVPAGVYAKAWLTRKGLWEKLKDKLIPTENVRGAVAAVEAGNADSAIVYRTDAKHGVVITDGPPIVYPAAVLRGAQNVDGAKRFLAFLQSPAARAVFRRYGFIVR
jgi:molybdate transport system substrate-binding protein